MQQRETGAGGLSELRANCWKGSDRDVEGSRDGSHPVMWARKPKLWLDTLYITADRIITHPKLPRNHFYLPKSICFPDISDKAAAAADMITTTVQKLEAKQKVCSKFLHQDCFKWQL